MATVMAGRPMQLGGLMHHGGPAAVQSGTASFTPTRKRLATVDAERIMAVVDLTIQKLELLIVLSEGDESILLDGLEGAPVGVREALQLHRTVEGEYNRRQSEETAAELIDSTRSLLRVISRAGSALPGLHAVTGKVPGGDQGPALLLGHLRMLRKILFERLLTTVDEERKRQEYLSGLIEREREANEEIEKLQREVDSAEDERNTEVARREATIARVLEDLEDITKHGQVASMRIERDAGRRIAKATASSEKKNEHLTEDIKTKMKQFEEMKAKNKAAEFEKRKRKQKTELNIQRLIEEFDVAMDDRQKEIDRINTLYDEEKKQLSELDERFKKLEVEYDIIMEERRVERDRREKAAEELAKMVKSALLVQRIWKAYKSRKALKKAQGKKGKGKKKK